MSWPERVLSRMRTLGVLVLLPCAACTGDGQQAVPGDTSAVTPTPSPTPTSSPTRAAPAPGPATAEPSCGPAEELVLRATWRQVEGRPSLRVQPGPGLRACRLATGTQEEAWSAVLASAPGADTPGMREQFVCHAVFAPGKEAWNLEPWRPTADPAALVAARCNPGGDDPDQRP